MATNVPGYTQDDYLQGGPFAEGYQDLQPTYTKNSVWENMLAGGAGLVPAALGDALGYFGRTDATGKAMSMMNGMGSGAGKAGNEYLGGLDPANLARLTSHSSVAGGFGFGDDAAARLRKMYELKAPLSQIKGADASRVFNATMHDANRLRSNLAGLNIGQQQGNLYGGMQRDIRRGAGYGAGPSSAYAAADAAGGQMRQASAGIYDQMAKQAAGNLSAAAGLGLAGGDYLTKNAQDRYNRLVRPYEVAHDTSTANTALQGANAIGSQYANTSNDMALTQMTERWAPGVMKGLGTLGGQTMASQFWNLLG